VALSLATIGVLGVVAYSVQQRSREFAVRRALGATSADVLTLVLGSAARLGLLGVIGGLALATLFSQTLEALLFNVEPLDATTFTLVGVLATVTVLAAALGPAVRASSIDPARMLHDE
jgi:putative ABC transport system permease protein